MVSLLTYSSSDVESMVSTSSTELSGSALSRPRRLATSFWIQKSVFASNSGSMIFSCRMIWL